MIKILVSTICGTLLLASIPPQAVAAVGALHNSVGAEFSALNFAPGSDKLLSQSAGGAISVTVPFEKKELAELKAKEDSTAFLKEQKAGQGEGDQIRSKCVRKCAYNSNGELECNQRCDETGWSSHSGGERALWAKVVLLLAGIGILILVWPSLSSAGY